MLTVISPAKRLNLTAPEGVTQPQFAADARALAKIARALTADDLCRLMDISPALGALNHARFAGFAGAQTFAAAHMFDGDTYTGLDFATMDAGAQHWAADNLRILSGLYGLLRPMDGIAPYRLEMGSRLANPQGGNLYAFWGSKIAKALTVQAKAAGARALLNCASQEYFGAVDLAALKLPVITPVFMEDQDGQGRIISFWAKQARGAMARYVCGHQLTNPDDLRGFNAGGYRHRADMSGDGKMVFMRPYQPLGKAALAAH